jgi:hypothetical protein
MRRPLALIACLIALASWPAVAGAAEPTTAPLALYGLSGEETRLARLDPLTLAPREPQTVMPEWHDGYSFSPDGRHAAFTVSTNGSPFTPGSGRVGMRVIDLTTLATAVDFRLGVAASAIGWLAPRRIIAKTQGAQIVVADPQTGGFRTTDRAVGPGCIDPPGKAVSRRHLVFLLGSTLNAVDRDGKRRHVRIRGMSNVCSRLGLAVDRARELAYVTGLGREVAVVSLRTMRVTYRRVDPSRASRVAYTRAELFGAFQVVAQHVNSRGMPKGVELVDFLGNTRLMLDPRAGGARPAGSRVLTYDGRLPVSPGGSKGIRAYDATGRLRYRTLTGEVVHRLEVLGQFAYAQTRGGLRVIDHHTGRVVSRSAFDPNLEVDFVLPERAGR